MIQLTANNQTVKIDAGELVSYQVEGQEFIHQKGSPGWRNADTEMFPIIGPTNEAGFQVQTPRGAAVQDQHGLLRELAYELVSQTDVTAVLQKSYRAGTRVNNSKYPQKSTAEQLAWPYDFTFTKTFELRKQGLQITFAVAGEAGMPFMLGYHPAFKLEMEAPAIHAKGKKISLAEVLAVGSRALPVLDCQNISLQDKKEVILKTQGFSHFMLWTEVPNMVCIEPITFYPYQVAQEQLHSGFAYLQDTEKVFSIEIRVQ